MRPLRQKLHDFERDFSLERNIDIRTFRVDEAIGTYNTSSSIHLFIQSIKLEKYP